MSLVGWHVPFEALHHECVFWGRPRLLFIKSGSIYSILRLLAYDMEGMEVRDWRTLDLSPPLGPSPDLQTAA